MPTLTQPTLADLDAILALINDPSSPHRREACLHRDEPEFASQLYDRLAEDDNLALVADGVVVGYASWQVFGAHAHLNVLAVGGEHQRQGLGRQLFTAFRQALLADAVGSYTLRAYRDSHWAIAFYARQGLAPLEQVNASCRAHPGLEHYLALAAAQGEWPAADKVLFFEALPK